MHYKDAKTILSPKNNMNLYRGCTHGCIYCDSRSACYNMEHAFEDVEVKQNAPALLDDALRRRRKPCMVGMGSMCDPYLPLERTELLTRRALELVYKRGFGLTLITKSDLVLRDIELLKAINEKTKCVVQLTLTTFDDALCGVIEPNVCPTSRRIEVLKRLSDEGIPTVVWLCPVLPFINDTEHNIRGILDACIDSNVRGVLCFGMGLTLRDGNREYFYEKLDAHFPGLKRRYINAYGLSYSCESPNSRQLLRLFHSTCENAGLMHEPDAIFDYISRFESRTAPEQLSFFDDGLGL